jgi:hypothetical protein
MHYKVTVDFTVKFRLLLKQKQLKTGNVTKPNKLQEQSLRNLVEQMWKNQFQILLLYLV